MLANTEAAARKRGNVPSTAVITDIIIHTYYRMTYGFSHNTIAANCPLRILHCLRPAAVHAWRDAMPPATAQ